MRTRILFRVALCLLTVPCVSHAVEPPAGRGLSCCDGDLRDIVAVTPSGVAPDRALRARERACRVAGERCAISSAEWTIYADSSPGAPDFWRTPSVEVREITVCEHGLQFLFPAVQDGLPRLAALVFPVPTADLIVQRLGVGTVSTEMQPKLTHIQQRYASLLRTLDELSGGWEGEMRRELPEGPGRPRIWPAPLVLIWGDAREPLRGYLDVYFTDPVPATVVASADSRQPVGPKPPVGAVAAAAPAVRLSLAVAPNPGGAAGYTMAFGLPAAGPAKLQLFDVAGRRVATLLDGDRPAGTARLRWDGRSASGGPVGAGVYFARLETVAGARTVKIVHRAR